MDNKSQEIRQALYEQVQKTKEARRSEIFELCDDHEFRHEAIKSLAKAESASFNVEVEQEAMYYVALAQVFATLELVETLAQK